MIGFTQFFSDIVTSSIWAEDNETRIVWVTLLAIAERDGIARAAVPGLAQIAGVSLEATEKAIAKFESPDPYSRSQEHEGRRVERVEGGFLLLNHKRYQEAWRTNYRREYQRIKQAEYRQRRRECPANSGTELK